MTENEQGRWEIRKWGKRRGGDREGETVGIWKHQKISRGIKSRAQHLVFWEYLPFRHMSIQLYLPDRNI